MRLAKIYPYIKSEVSSFLIEMLEMLVLAREEEAAAAFGLQRNLSKTKIVQHCNSDFCSTVCRV